MKKILFVYGLPATGKTTLCETLCEHLRLNNIKSLYLRCDEIAKISVHCQYSESELNLKYRNIISILENLFSEESFIVIDDNLKRQIDADTIYNYVSKKTTEYVFVKTYLNDGFKEARLRNQIRSINSVMPEGRLQYYYETFSEISVLESNYVETSNSLICCMSSILSLIGV